MITRPNITTRIASPLLVGLLAITACGSDDVAESTPTAETTAIDTAAQDTSAPDTTASDTSNTSESATSDTEADSVEPAAGGSYEQFCTTLEEYIQSPSDPDVADDPSDFQPVVDVAPPEIADDMQKMMEGFVELYEFDEMTASDADMAEFEAAIAEFEPVATRLEAWSTENCPGYDLE